MQTERIPSGPAIAAFTAAAIGLLAMAVANLLQETVKGFDQTLMALGSWMPNQDGIGSYSGAETILLVAWLGSWAVLHLLLREKHMGVRPWTIALVIGVALATLLVWPPFIDFLIGR
ncbi:MAG: hypothetical protein HY259_00880 [Chloroflexi bacterium]|nr:hypothetical protein [Chloroflexota bacterium]MBI3732003.1 hypothetical protein [Chloroflexota bacterium]